MQRAKQRPKLALTCRSRWWRWWQNKRCLQRTPTVCLGCGGRQSHGELGLHGRCEVEIAHSIFAGLPSPGCPRFPLHVWVVGAKMPPTHLGWDTVHALEVVRLFTRRIFLLLLAPARVVKYRQTGHSGVQCNHASISIMRPLPSIVVRIVLTTNTPNVSECVCVHVDVCTTHLRRTEYVDCDAEHGDLRGDETVCEHDSKSLHV